MPKKITANDFIIFLRKKFNKLNDLGYSIYYMWEDDWKSWNRDKTCVFPIKKYNDIKI